MIIRGTFKHLPIFLVALLAAATGVSAETAPEAFPEAVGHGRFAQGGRGGAVIAVTNLNDSGPGSLRACVEASGPRNCIFKVAGTITLSKSLRVGPDNGSLSILGQTAPGSGIVLTIQTPDKEGKNTPLAIDGAENVIVRHLRVRPRLPNSVKNVHAVVVEASNDVYLDHLSVSWATDENISTYASATNVTIANSILAEGLNKHSKCTLLGADPRSPQNISFIGNLCLSNRDRNPDNNHYGQSCIEILNNLFFNASSEWAEVFSQYPGGTPISYVGNYFKAGPSTHEKTFAITAQSAARVADPQIFEQDNVIWAPAKKTMVLMAPGSEKYLVSKPPCPLTVSSPVSAKAAYENVRRSSGAFPRDGLDEKWIRDVGDIGEGGKGRMVNVPGNIAPAVTAAPYRDDDGDGMADAMEAKFSAKAGVDDAWVAGPDGQTAFDLFMQWLSDERIAGRYPS